MYDACVAAIVYNIPFIVTMRAERASLSELGLLPDAASQWPLATWLDHTHAKPAHDALKRLIASPLSDLHELRSRQALLPQLAAVAPQLRWHELQMLATQVARYLSSNYELVPVTRIERALFVIRYRDIVADLSQQLHAVDMLLRLSAHVGSRIASIPADSTFATVVDAFAAASQDSRGRQLRRAVERGNTLRLVSFDPVVRAKKVLAGHQSSDPIRSLRCCCRWSRQFRSSMPSVRWPRHPPPLKESFLRWCRVAPPP